MLLFRPYGSIQQPFLLKIDPFIEHVWPDLRDRYGRDIGVASSSVLAREEGIRAERTLRLFDIELELVSSTH